MITLRPATLDDLNLLRHWDEQPHVIAADPNDDWHWQVELDRTPDWREQLIAEMDSRPIGFIQIIDPAREESQYWGDVAENLRAIDIWIGEATDLGKGYGTQMMELAIARCFADPAVTAILIDPLVSNTRAHRFYERLGFQFVEYRRFGEDDCCVYKLLRTDWQEVAVSSETVSSEAVSSEAVSSEAVLSETIEPWMLDEGAIAGRENLDINHATQYDQKEDASALEELAFLGRLGLNQQSEVVDMGAGTGQFTLAVAPVCARVVAVDVSPVMLDVLKAKVKASQLTNIEVIQSGFLTYKHQGKKADFVYSRYALHHLPDFWKALALQRLRQIVRTGGVLRLWDVVYNFELSETSDRLNAWCATLSVHSEEGWTRTDIEEHIRDEHSTFTWLLEPMIERSRFQIEEAVYSSDGIFAKYVARAV
jgi:RimJ/RimL family protein N-acetyltransferase/ubiquinone/menaquinone biosynthesis C-methylase UbiE